MQRHSSHILSLLIRYTFASNGIISDVGFNSDDLAIVLFWLRKNPGPLQPSAVVITDS